MFFKHLIAPYDLIMADPPWSYENWSKKGSHKNASAHYDCMRLDDIKSMNTYCTKS